MRNSSQEKILLYYLHANKLSSAEAQQKLWTFQVREAACIQFYKTH